MNSTPPMRNGAGILLVEDEMIIAFELKIRLEALGHHVVSNPRKGEDAVRMAAEKQPNLVLMDISLAGEMDGIEAARRIRDARRVPVIFVTANTDEATRRRAMSLSPEGFLLKPFTDAEFKEAISTALTPSSFR